MTVDVGVTIGRERTTLLEALRAGRSVLVHGARGVGKTSVVPEVASSWDVRQEGRLLLYAGDCSTRRALVRGLVENLFEALGALRTEGLPTIK
jgi:predicted AAA+ superfamily ATPase